MQIEFNVSGVTFEDRPNIIRRYATDGDTIYLVREPNNEYDSNAIKVFLPNRKSIGYVPKEFTPLLAKYLDSGGSIFAKVKSVNNRGEDLQSITISISTQNKAGYVMGDIKGFIYDEDSPEESTHDIECFGIIQYKDGLGTDLNKPIVHLVACYELTNFHVDDIKERNPLSEREIYLVKAFEQVTPNNALSDIGYVMREYSKYVSRDSDDRYQFKSLREDVVIQEQYHTVYITSEDSLNDLSKKRQALETNYFDTLRKELNNIETQKIKYTIIPFEENSYIFERINEKYIGEKRYSILTINYHLQIKSNLEMSIKEQADFFNKLERIKMGSSRLLNEQLVLI
ncbi:HIRAN domain-containing protein [Paenibacillus uliginis N3/975]|uniref:HIRAN domain-containing protein n=1 Tax=Paenibacillus uliginis N3/975 TaxID=1313296 RepID=A0A1X7HQ94_9BACL|nr:HIRAN domain-containing protein [Paenibacillus uliginis]SMF90445.1 HIRAN domain-containing protein [Paenibacillus uliginis N3/975]